MRLHQVTLRKDGPVHAIEHLGGTEYADTTLCGAGISVLHEPVRRRFEAAERRCKRCLNAKVRV